MFSAGAEEWFTATPNNSSGSSPAIHASNSFRTGEQPQSITKRSLFEDFKLDNNEAMKWFRMAAEQGHVPAQYDLGMLLVMGEGVIPNYVQAYA